MLLGPHAMTTKNRIEAGGTTRNLTRWAQKTLWSSASCEEVELDDKQVRNVYDWNCKIFGAQNSLVIFSSTAPHQLQQWRCSMLLWRLQGQCCSRVPNDAASVMDHAPQPLPSNRQPFHIWSRMARDTASEVDFDTMENRERKTATALQNALIQLRKERLHKVAVEVFGRKETQSKKKERGRSS